jgi:hypothetical protein
MRHSFPVRGHARVSAIIAAVERSGGKVLQVSSPLKVPFELRVELPRGGVLDLVCYAFSARAYSRRGNIGHRILARRGRGAARPQWLHLDEERRRITLLLGIHFEREIFLGLDPRAHDPMLLPSTIELRDEELTQGMRSGWHGWERERSARGKRKLHHLENLTTEIILAFRAEHFLAYALFEAGASGLDAGERLLLLDKLEESLLK